MIPFLQKQIPYSSSFRTQLLIGALLGIVVSFIMVFLQPFDTYSFESKHKYLIMFGFGIILLIGYLINARLENFWYHHKDKKWMIKDEIIWFISLLFISSIIIHFYNQVFLNDLFTNGFNLLEYVKHGLWFLQHSIIPMVLIVLPFHIFLRNKFGKIETSPSSSEIELNGINKGEQIRLQRQELLFVKASENYVEIFYLENNSTQHKTFRNTLTSIKTQAPFLYRCHRSYLVNTSAIKTVDGNSQNAKIKLHHSNLELPLSKSYFKTLKSALDFQPK